MISTLPVDLWRRVVVLAPTGRDAEVMSSLLSSNAIDPVIVPDVAALCGELLRGAGAALIAAEALTPQAMRDIALVLDEHPSWSELPLLIFAPEPSMDRVARTFDELGPRAQITLVDRPVRVGILISLVRSALRSRERQIETAGLLRELEENAERLEGLAEASLAVASTASVREVIGLVASRACDLTSGHEALLVANIDLEGQRCLIAEARADCRTEVREEMALKPELPIQLHGMRRLEKDDPAVEAIWKLTGEQRSSDHPLLGAPIRERDGRPVGVLLVAVDEARPPAADESVLAQLASLASAAIQKARLYDQAEAASHAKDEFLANLSHELRTPMTTVLGWVQMLRMGLVADGELETALSIIESNIRLQSRLVEDILDVSRIIAGKLPVEFQPLELRPVVEDAAEAFRGAAAERRVRVALDLTEEPLAVWADPTRIQQILSNLLSNAVKFTPPDGSIRIELKKEGREAVICVEDDGEGIDGDFLPYVFERFRQADASTSRPHGGLGIGLAIVGNLVSLSGGKIEAHSDGKGLGSKFTVRLPLGPFRFDDTEPLPEPAPRIAGRVLLVEQDEYAAAEISAFLAASGCEVHRIPTPKEVSPELARFDPDVVLWDFVQDGEDRTAALDRLRSVEWKARVMAFAPPARVTDEGARLEGLIARPAARSELLAKLQSVLNQ